MREGGAILARALQAAVDAVKPGVTMKELDGIVTKVIEDAGGRPSFKGYTSGGSTPFPTTTCISRNEEVVHGLGNRTVVLEEGDIVGLDIGCWYKDLCTDMAVTVPVGKIKDEYKMLMLATRDAMMAGVEQAIVGKSVKDISRAIEGAVDQRRYGIVKSLVGHGVGHAVHEGPNVPNYVSKRFPSVELKPGMCLAIEPMLTLGGDEVGTGEDGWTIVTLDGSWAAHFEVTIALLPEGPEILTPLPDVGI
ncbi:MAG: methionyl aminopeptidase [Patescibacteria group bacterium]|nr:methionyl aminopeptidase [Patescibacteria group bacterium]